MTTCACSMCTKADACDRDGQRAAGHAFRLLCKTRRAERQARALYTREAAAGAVLAELTSLTPATSEGDDR